jgi:hypothetical protein
MVDFEAVCESMTDSAFCGMNGYRHDVEHVTGHPQQYVRKEIVSYCRGAG